MSSLKPLVGPNIFQNLKPSLTFWTLDSPLSCFSNLLSVSLTVQPLVSLISTAIGRYFQSRCLLKMRFPFLPPLCLLSTLWVRDSARCWDPNIMRALFYVLPVKYPVLYTSGQIKHSWSSLVHDHIWYTWKYEQLKGSLWGNWEYEFMLLQLLEGSHKESSSRETDSTTSHFCVCHGDFCICFLQRNTSRSCVKGELQVFYRIILYPYFDSCGFPSLCPLPSFPTSISSIGYISQDSLLVLF